MRFARPDFLWMLAVVLPAMLLFFWWSARERRRLMTQFIQARLLPNLLAGVSPGRDKFRSACLMAAALFIILALARPQWGYEQQEVRQRGIDIIVGIDTSKSMLAEDIPPNRLARAKLAVQDLIQVARSDRLGIVAFAGTAFLHCPLTIDDSAFRRSLDALDVNTLPVGGTAIAEAIETATKAFQKGDNFKVLVLFTDGEDHDTGALAAAERAAEAGLRIYTIGVGSSEGELLRIPGPNGQTTYIRDREGNVVKSRLNEQLLRDIAAAAQGFYLPLHGARTIETLYQQGLAPLPKSVSEEKWVRRPREQFHWPLAIAIAILAFEFLFPNRKSVSRQSTTAVGRSTSLARASAALFVFASVTTLAAADASPRSALRDYREGRYNEALETYERALQKNSDDPRLHFNAGSAAYQSGNFEKAAEHFAKALEAPDLELQQKAYYNLANTLYRLGEQTMDPAKKTDSWREAIKRYENSLKLDESDTDAQFNRQFVQKRLEELQQQQQQQQQQSGNDDPQQQQQQQSGQGGDQEQNQNQNQNQNQQQQQQQGEQQQGEGQQQEQEQKQQQQGNQEQQQEQGNEEQSAQQQNGEQGEPQQQNQQQNQQQEQGSGEEQRASAGQGEQRDNEGAAQGEMTQAEAERLLDAQKGNEKVLPVPPQTGTGMRRRPDKDW